ncbi:hypothetical protein HJFPF1_07779 [Paramyrothecium foliicola]|nr:hypothetical protein HJFPF1_07779 [Paramyrothecium foliicola]
MVEDMGTPCTTSAEPGPFRMDVSWQAKDFIQGSRRNREIDQNEDHVRRDLKDVEKWGNKNSDDPYTLKLWLRYLVQQRRYQGLDPDDKEYLELDARPTNGKIWPSRDMAKLFKLGVIHHYPGRGVVVGSNPADGEEDFMAIGGHFSALIEERGLATSNLYVRNDHCLIIDEKSLRTLMALSGQTPPPGPTDLVAEDGSGFYNAPLATAWVWMLDREYYGRCLRGVKLPPHGRPDERRYQPWVRIYMGDLPRLWFFRPRGMSPPTWESIVERDEEMFDAVNWWGDASAETRNQVLRMSRWHGKS